MAGGDVPFMHKASKSEQLEMNTLYRPEYYVIPGRHPADCRCSEHALKRLLSSAAKFAARTSGVIDGKVAQPGMSPLAR
jgi:hypothetical protein